MLAAIFSIITEEKEIHLAILHSCIFQTIELNYDIYNKELLIVFIIIYFYPGCLEPKPDTISHREYLYSKKERAAYNSIKSHNMCSIFTYSQLITSL